MPGIFISGISFVMEERAGNPGKIFASLFSTSIYKEESYEAAACRREKPMNIEELYRTYFDIVYRYIRSISQDGALAEEVTQETFFKALEKIDQFRGDCDVRVWLCQIAKNTLYDHLKKQKKQLLGDEKLEEAESDGGELLEEKLAQRSQAMEIHKVLHRLSEPYKEVFSLRTFGELKFSEIGMLFGKSENWARVTYYRARVKIREELEQ